MNPWKLDPGSFLRFPGQQLLLKVEAKSSALLSCRAMQENRTVTATTMLCFIMCYDVLCSALLCCGMAWHGMAWHAMPCYAMLCHAMLVSKPSLAQHLVGQSSSYLDARLALYSIYSKAFAPNPRSLHDKLTSKVFQRPSN